MTRMFEFQDGTSAKFWEITLEDCELKTRYGRLGTNGQGTNKTFENIEKAKKEFEKLIKEKTSKGYFELGANTAPETMYLEHRGLNKFFEISENNNQLRIRRGMVGQPCLVFHAGFRTKGRENFERLVKEWKEKGFVVTQPNTPILTGSIADELIAAAIEDQSIYSRLFDLGWGEELRGQQRRIFVFRNGLNFQGNLELAEIADMDLTTGLIVDGDVKVIGVLSQLEYTYPNPILITGNVTAQSLGHKDSHMRIDGDVRVENIVYGEYNDGSLEIGGSVYGNAWISADHNMWASGTYHLPTFHDETQGLSPKVLTLEGRLDWDALRECIFARKSPLHKDFVFIPPEPEPIIEEAQTSELYKQIRALAQIEDVEGLTQLLESWQEHDHEWQEFVQARLVAPSSTPEQQKRLQAVLELLSHDQNDVAELFRQHYPDTNIWAIPIGGQVQEPEEAHPKILELLNIDGWEEMLEALETPPDEHLIQCHSWFLLVNLVRRTDALDDDYINVIERLLELGTDSRAQFEGMNLSVVQLAERLEAHKILELFYQHSPDLRPEERPEDIVYDEVVLYKLIQLEDTGTDFEDAQVKQLWLEPVKHLAVVAEKLKRIPESLGKLSQLRTLALVMIEPKGRKLPTALGDLLKLESLVLGMSGFNELPGLFKLTQLKKLSLRDNSFKDLSALPDQLEELMLDQNPLSDQTNLSNLTKLKHLSLHGVKTIPKGLEHLVQLEELHWSNAKLEIFPESIAALPKLRQLVMSGNRFVTLPNLQGLSELEELDLQNCRLERLPEGLLELPKLKKLLLAGNRKLEKLLDKTKDAASLKILEVLRDRGVVFTSDLLADDSQEEQTPQPKKKNTSTRNALKQVKELNQKGHDAQTTEPANVSQALDHYEHVLERAEPFLADFPEDFAHEYLFALQGKLWCVNELAEHDPTRVPQAIALARSVLEFAQNQFNMYYSESGQLARGAQMLAHNTLAWYLLAENGDLNQALEHVNAAIEDLDYSSEDGTYAVVLETKVKILLALGRSDEAHAVVYQMHRSFPSLPFFKNLTQTAQYQQWDAEN